MCRFPLRSWLVGALAATTLTGCEMLMTCHCDCSNAHQGEPPLMLGKRLPDQPLSHAPAFASTVPPATTTQAQGPALPAIPELAPTSAVVPSYVAAKPAPSPGPILPPPTAPPPSPSVLEAPPPVVTNPTPTAPPDIVKWLPPAGNEEHRTLVGKLEPGYEHGTWNLRCNPDPTTNRPGEVVRLVASQPLAGCREGREVRVEGSLSQGVQGPTLQVESMTALGSR